MTIEIQPYRIGWGRLPRMLGEYRRLLPLIARGVQGDGQRVPRSRWLPKIRRDLRTLLTHHPKYLLHLPWMAEAEDLRFARRGLTAAAARRRTVADLEHEQRTGERSRYQRYRWWRARRWDRKNLATQGSNHVTDQPKLAAALGEAARDLRAGYPANGYSIEYINGFEAAADFADGYARPLLARPCSCDSAAHPARLASGDAK